MGKLFVLTNIILCVWVKSVRNNVDTNPQHFSQKSLKIIFVHFYQNKPIETQHYHLHKRSIFLGNSKFRWVNHTLAASRTPRLFLFVFRIINSFPHKNVICETSGITAFISVCFVWRFVALLLFFRNTSLLLKYGHEIWRPHTLHNLIHHLPHTYMHTCAVSNKYK